MFVTIETCCLLIRRRLVENYPGYWRRYGMLFAMTCVAALADLLTTMRFMATDGVEAELHPAIRMASIALGPVLGPLVGKLAQVLAIVVVTVYCRRFAVGIFMATTLMYAWAAWYNEWGRWFYSPLLVDWLSCWASPSINQAT